MADKIYAKKSNISGKGVFALEDIKKGDKICDVTGELISLPEMISRVDSDFEEGSDPLGVGDELYFDLDELSRSFNHSCEPNSFLCGSPESIQLIALRDILRGEEIFYDYSTTMDDNIPRKYQWTMKCKCGSKSCRKIVDQFKRMPKKRQEFYIQNKFAPEFILNKFG